MTLRASVLLMEQLRNGTSTDETKSDKIVIPLYAVILIAFGALIVLTYTYCFFCVPSSNKRKIYAMMREAKLEDEGHH